MQEEETIPLYFKTLEKTCPPEIWHSFRSHMDPCEEFEKDKNGNTALMCAIVNGKSADFIAEMISASAGCNLTQRNATGQTPQELAEHLQRNDIVDEINKFILESMGQQVLINFPICFYGNDKLQLLTDKNQQSLTELAMASGNQDDIQAVCNYKAVERCGVQLLRAATSGSLVEVAKLNQVSYQDKNGYTALIKAIVFDQLKAAEILITERPQLKSIADNCNRYPLHYAYALPEEQGLPFVQLLLAKDASEIDHKVDKDGREAAEYKDLRDSPEIEQMLYDARTLDPYGKRAPPVASLPE